MMLKQALGRLSTSVLLLFLIGIVFYVAFLFSSPKTTTNILYCCDYMGRTYCAVVPLHPDQRSHNGFYTRLPKNLKFDGHDWECTLRGVVFRHYWPPALIDPDTHHMDLILENKEMYRVPVDLDGHLTPQRVKDAIELAGRSAVEKFFGTATTATPPRESTPDSEGSTEPSPLRVKRHGKPPPPPPPQVLTMTKFQRTQLEKERMATTEPDHGTIAWTSRTRTSRRVPSSKRRANTRFASGSTRTW